MFNKSHLIFVFLVLIPFTALRSRSSLNKKGAISGAKWRTTLFSPKHLNGVEQAKVYPEDPNYLFLTLGHGGLAIYDISIPENPTFISYWDKKTPIGLYGQDRLGDMLVVVGKWGEIYTLDVSNPKDVKVLGHLKFKKIYGQPKLKATPTLHVKIFKGKKGKVYSLVSNPSKKKVLLLGLNNPKKPKLIKEIYTGIQNIRNISIWKKRAYISGEGGAKLVSFSLKKLKKIKLNKKLTKKIMGPGHKIKSFNYPDHWFYPIGKYPGGLEIYKTERRPWKVRKISNFLHPELSFTKEILPHGDYLFLSLNQRGGGIGIVNIKNPEKPKFITSLKNIPDLNFPSTIKLNGEYLYAFDSKKKSMVVLKLLKKQSGKNFGVWNFSSSCLDNMGLSPSGLSAEEGRGELYLIDTPNIARNSSRFNRAWTNPKSTYNKLSSQLSSSKNSPVLEYIRFKKTKKWDRGNGFFLRHFAPSTPGSSYLRKYSLIFDLRIPQEGRPKWGDSFIPLFQTHSGNRAKANLFLKVLPNNEIQVGRLGGFGGLSKKIARIGQWFRLTITVNLDPPQGQDALNVFVDGHLVFKVNRVNTEKFSLHGSSHMGDDPNIIALMDGIFLFADPSGEINSFDLSSFSFSDRVLGENDIKRMGGVKNSGIEHHFLSPLSPNQRKLSFGQK